MTLWQIRTVVDDEPGRLAALAGSLADLSVNILSVQVHPVVAGAVDDFVADAPSSVTAEELTSAVAAGGGRRAVVRPADVHGLADPPTRALQLAARLVRDPECLPLALSDLLDGSAVEWSPAGVPVSGDDVRLRDPRGGHLRVVRPDSRLTPSEEARAHALADLASVLAAPAEDTVAWRRAGLADLEAIAAMHDRCSDEARFRRYNSGVTRPAPRQLARLVNPRLGVALVGETADGNVVALGNLMWCGLDDATPAELGLLVEDAWQARGLGTAVTRRLLAAARDASCDAVHAVVRPDNIPMLRLLAGLGLPTHRHWDDGSLTVVVDLPAVLEESADGGRL